VFVVFFLVPLALIVMVSFWQATDYELIPAFTLQSLSRHRLGGCFDGGAVRHAAHLPEHAEVQPADLGADASCIGFTVAYFLAFHVRSTLWQTVLFILCTVPFWTSNVIRMISWIPLLGRNGLVNDTLVACSAWCSQPVEWLLFSDFSVVLAFVHLYTMFMIVPIFNSMMRIDRALIEAARDNGASAWQTVWHVVVPLCKTGIVIGSIFVIALVMGDFITVGVMGGQQIASVGKTIQVQAGVLQFPAAAANAVVLLGVVLLMIVAHDARWSTCARSSEKPWRSPRQRRSLLWLLALLFAAFVLFLYGPMLAIFVLSFQGPEGGLTFPLRGVVAALVCQLWEGIGVVDIGAAFRRSLGLGAW
jgi:putative spermidine/putrescine transport system permease protein